MSVFRPCSVRVLNDVPVPMRDGVRLSADVYLPGNGSGPWPVLLARTPCDNNLVFCPQERPGRALEMDRAFNDVPGH